MSDYSDGLDDDLMAVAMSLATAADEGATAEAPDPAGQAQHPSREDDSHSEKNFLLFNESLGIFICSGQGESCGIGFLTLKTLHAHLKSFHGFDKTLGDLPLWIREKMPLMTHKYDDPRLDSYQHPTRVMPPVEGVKTEQGFGCKNCFKGFRAQGTFRNHASSSACGCKPSHQVESDIQKLFNGQYYFRVQSFPELAPADQALLARLSEPASFLSQSTEIRGDSITPRWKDKVAALGLENTVLRTLLPVDPMTRHYSLVDPIKATITAWISHFFKDIYPILAYSTQMALCSENPE